MFEEEQLLGLLRTIAKSPPLAADRFDPRRLILAVNTLQPLGKDKALAALSEYLRVSGDTYLQENSPQRVFLILRALFDVPTDPGHMPPMRVGAPHPSTPKDPKQIPRFPLAIVDDVPVMLVYGYSLGGAAAPPGDQVEYFREHCKLRDKPLVPPDKPLDLYDRAVKVSDALDDDGELRRTLGGQLLWLVDTVYRPPWDERTHGSGGDKFGAWREPFAPRLEQARADVAKLDVRWDPKVNRYAFAKDGTALPDRVEQLYRREVWRPGVAGRNEQLVVEREDEKFVSVGVSWTSKGGTKYPPTVVRLYAWDPANPEAAREVAKFDLHVRDDDFPRPPFGGRGGPPGAPAAGDSHSSSGTTVKVPAGWQVRATIQVVDGVYETKPWTP
jgi:hypothetical protein